MQVDSIMSRSFICSHKGSVCKTNTLPLTLNLKLSRNESLTINVELIKTIDRFEHGVSYRYFEWLIKANQLK